jgi:hypothetical protein
MKWYLVIDDIGAAPLLTVNFLLIAPGGPIRTQVHRYHLTTLEPREPVNAPPQHFDFVGNAGVHDGLGRGSSGSWAGRRDTVMCRAYPPNYR